MFLVVGLGPVAAASIGATVDVAVSVPPQAYLVDRIGGDRVRTQSMIPPGASPETFDPSPRQVLGLGRAALYVRVGHQGFAFEDRLLDPLFAQHPEITVVDMWSSAVTGRGSVAAVNDGHRHGADGEDPHVWLSPQTMAAAAIEVARALESIDPEGAETYRANLDRFLVDVEALDREIAAGFADMKERSILVFHPAWGWFARRYGLEQVAIEDDGREPSPARLVDLIEEARDRGWSTIFVQRGSSGRSASVLADEIGAEVVIVDPLAYDWLANLRAVAAGFRRALLDAEAAPVRESCP